MQNIFTLLILVIEVFKWILLGRILLSWLPNIDWYKQPWKTIDAITEPVLEPFRRLIPPFGGIDFSPMVLFLVLNLVQGALAKLA
ncbi:MAG: YggT family protein [Vampirovibrionales bacterium]|nr:YggT family protein [Vampirovibrionales bacterium]